MHVMMMKKNRNKKIQNLISEGLEFEDLKGLVDNVIMIDRHKPKIGSEEDTVVVAFTVMYEEPAKDLSQFIESSPVDHLDVEVSGSPDAEGKWDVFVEFMRDHNLLEKIEAMLNNVDQITSRQGDGWQYRAFNIKKPIEFNAENFNRDIINSRYEYRKRYLGDKSDKPTDKLEEGWFRRLGKYLDA